MLANFMRLSLQKAAHANPACAAFRKSGSQPRTWDEKDGAQPLPTLLLRERIRLHLE
jgi:hypothetical protein